MFPQSLVKYESPQLVLSHAHEFDTTEVKKSKDESLTSEKMDDLESEDEEEMEQEESVELLDILLPPRKYEESGKLWIQRVSRSPATETDILNLQDQFDKQLTTRGAREIGICPIRRNLYSQCFDELIRQEIIACPERGKLYKRIRIETQMTVDTLRKVYESNIAYGIKKVLTKIKNDQDLKANVTVLVAEKSGVVQRLEQLQATLDETEAKMKEELDEMMRNNEAKEMKFKEDNEMLMDEMRAFLDRDFLEYEND